MRRILPALGLLLTTSLWGWSFIYQKDILETVHPLTLLTYGFGLAVVPFAVIAIFQKKSLLFRLKEGLFLGLLLFLVEGPQTIGLDITSPTNTAFISGFGVLLVPLLERLVFKKRIPIIVYLTLLLALAGLYLLTGGVSNLNTGDLWVFLCAIAIAFYIIFTDRYEKEERSSLFVLCGQQFLAVTLLGFLFALLAKAPLVIESSYDWSRIIIMALFLNVIPYILVQWGERIVSTMAATFIYVLEPAFTVLFAWVLLSQTPSADVVFGGMLIIIATCVSEIALARASSPFAFSETR